MKKKVHIACGLTLIGMLTSGLIASVAWFVPGTNSFSANISGNVVEEYFHCGSGTESDPFVITRPVHYYHLTEFFQRKTELPVTDGTAYFGEEYLYFQVGYDLDGDGSLEVYDYDNTGTYRGTSSVPAYSKTLNMSYYSENNALMPIGTSEVPFIGSFDGGAQTTAANGITIDNLHIKCADTVVVDKSPTDRKTSDVGVFGYVADSDGSTQSVIQNAYFNNLIIDLTDIDDSATGDGHEDEHENEEMYVGYLVGHMHTYTNYDAEGPTNASPIHDVYVNNAKIEGGAGVQSNFGYVGKADTIDGEEYDINDIIDELEAQASPGDNDWGGSIDARSYNMWTYDLYKTTTTSTNGTVYEFSNMQSASDSTGVFNRKYFSDFTLQFATNYKTGVYGKNGNYTSYNYYMNPDCFNEPLDGHSVRNTSGIYCAVYQLKDNNYIPLKFADDTKTSTSLKNTGYIVGSAYGSSSSITASPKLSSYYYSSIGNSLQNTYWNVNSALTNKTLSYTNSNLEILTYSTTDDEWYRISDDYNASHNTTNTGMTPYTKKTYSELGFGKYKESRDVIKRVSESSNRMHGIHFENNEISTSSKLTVNSGIKINGTAYTTPYQLLKGSVEFNLKKDGFINFFAGTYFTATRNFNFFSLYKVNRTGGTIDSIDRISQIYRNSGAGPKYVYKYSNGSYSEGTPGTLMFDVEKALESDAVLNNALYYFEVPVNSGDYAMGMVPGKSASTYTGAYMMYLDIGANGNSGDEPTYDSEHKIAEDPVFTQIEYTSDGYVINACFNIAYVIPAGSTKKKFSIEVSRVGDVFELVIVNTSGNVFDLAVLLVDDDGNPDNDYPYTYTITYNDGETSEEYDFSGKFTGASSGTEMTVVPPPTS